jgi:L-amino acid N-acyltransferase YncA
MELRPVTPHDIADVLQLQAACFIGNLGPEDRGGGFVSSAFTRQQLEEIAKDGALVVASENDRVIGYLCAASCPYYQQFPLHAALIRHFPEVRYAGRPLDSYRSFIYGPVCIHRGYRGRGILFELYQELLRLLGTKYDLGVALISNDNHPSFSAHVRKLGMALVGNYEFKGEQFNIVAFKVPSS